MSLLSDCRSNVAGMAGLIYYIHRGAALLRISGSATMNDKPGLYGQLGSLAHQGRHDLVDDLFGHHFIARVQGGHLYVNQLVDDGAFHVELELAALEVVVAGVQHADDSGFGNRIPLRSAPRVAVNLRLPHYSNGDVPFLQSQAFLPEFHLVIEPGFERVRSRTTEDTKKKCPNCTHKRIVLYITVLGAPF